MVMEMQFLIDKDQKQNKNVLESAQLTKNVIITSLNNTNTIQLFKGLHTESGR